LSYIFNNGAISAKQALSSLPAKIRRIILFL